MGVENTLTITYRRVLNFFLLQALKIFFGRLRSDLSNNWGGYVLFNAVGPNDENVVGMVFLFYLQDIHNDF